MSLERLTTEGRNPASAEIDRFTALEIVRLMNDEDARVAPAVRREEAAIAEAVDVVADRLRRGGHLVYIGAGTSGRLGVLDASECPPTFNTEPGQIVGLIAGGRDALTQAVEGAEDHPEAAVRDLDAIGLSDRDVLVGVATSGRTPYVLAGLEHARRLGAFAIALSCNHESEITRAADLAITPVVGPEVVTGSTRLKAGTATKLVLNTITTAAMIRLGKTYGNLMVDLQAKNQKLEERSTRIVALLADVLPEQAREALDRAGGDVKTTIVSQRREVSPEQARRLLEAAGGRLRDALELEGGERRAESGEHKSGGRRAEGGEPEAEGGSTDTLEPASSSVAESDNFMDVHASLSDSVQRTSSSVGRKRGTSRTDLEVRSTEVLGPMSNYVLGIDGGGTKTIAWIVTTHRSLDAANQQAALSSADTAHHLSPVTRHPTFEHPAASAQHPIGVGVAGGTNPQTADWGEVVGNLNRAVDEALRDAGLPRAAVAAACAAIAGSDRDEVRTRLEDWAAGRGLARKFNIVHDGEALLYAGSPAGVGVALISGTGSFAFGRNENGETARSGGWGPIFGDEGSGYAIAVAALRAAAHAIDGRGPSTSLVEILRRELGLKSDADLIAAVYAPDVDRARIASLAEVVALAATSGDEVATSILDRAAADLASMVQALVERLEISPQGFPLILGGGVLVNCRPLRDRLDNQLRTAGLVPEPSVVVEAPVAGAVQIALAHVEEAASLQREPQASSL